MDCACKAHEYMIMACQSRKVTNKRVPCMQTAAKRTMPHEIKWSPLFSPLPPTTKLVTSISFSPKIKKCYIYLDKVSSFCMHVTRLLCPSLLERHHHFLSAQAHSTSFPRFELTKGLFKENTKFIGDINHFTFKDRLEVNFQKRSLIISLSHFLSVFNQLTPINPTTLTSLLKNAKSKNQIFLSKASP